MSLFIKYLLDTVFTKEEIKKTLLISGIIIFYVALGYFMYPIGSGDLDAIESWYRYYGPIVYFFVRGLLGDLIVTLILLSAIIIGCPILAIYIDYQQWKKKHEVENNNSDFTQEIHQK